MYRRHLEHKLRESLADTRVVMIAGPRQSGKTTLARQLTNNTRTYVTLDDEATYQAATDDPVSFIGQFDYATIDEVQRAPELIHRIKIAVDEDQRPGRFLLTGSANILTIPTVSESLAGRMAIETLLPLSQGEIAGRERNILDALFETPNKGFPFGPYATEDIEERVLKGGYPEMLTRKSATRRRAWADNYIQTLLSRDIKEILDAYRLQDIDRLMQSCAIQSAQLVVYANVANDLQISTPTVQRYMRSLEQMYLLAFLPAWHRNALKRLVKTPKLHFLDSGLLSSVRRLTSARIGADRGLFGSLLESFVYAELQKHAACSDHHHHFYHYRDKDKVEVDFVIERNPDALIGVAVKASATVRQEDFKGLQRLQSVADKSFVGGALLYTGDKALPFGARLMAIPISAFWL